ncbi:S26 family signal peptidase [Rubrivirga litoralis]|uniref:S26 family signal peptidase n=1 Tax=Rubrivirga litoralis TaxID=3075598 RepID=A0ABU3BUJ0_9BACT|nr:S26 family signal peptidase [Rubrivirga sp. F394]MDT0632954.1 S26 family signal peptidase [Rubrivirga sp. F394]
MAVVAALALFGVRINFTESLPRGFYLSAPVLPQDVRRGQLVTFCPHAEAVAAVAPYLLAGSACPGPDGPASLLALAKMVVAVPGDTVTVDSAGVRVGSVALARSAPLAYSRSGQPVTAALGTHVLGPGEFWMHSSRVAYSLDSRYFGPVRDVRRVIRPVLVEGGPEIAPVQGSRPPGAFAVGQ